MKTSLLLVYATFALGLAGSAMADARLTATPQTSRATPGKLIAARTAWHRAVSGCVIHYVPNDAQSVEDCQDLAKRVDPIASYTQHKPLDDNALAKSDGANDGT